MSGDQLRQEQPAEQLARAPARAGRSWAGTRSSAAPSSEMPPPGTIMWTCGWWVSAEPQVWSTDGDADAGAEVLGIGRDREHGLGRGLEQDVVDHRLVVVGDVGDLGRQREHDVEVGHRQQLGLALGQPLLGCRALTLRAMAVAAGVVGDLRVGALLVLAARDMAAERRRAAVSRSPTSPSSGRGSHGRHWLGAMPVRGRGRYPRPPALDGTWPRPLRGRLGFPVLPGLVARQRQQVERALDRAIMLVATRV